jgi:protein TonB
MVFEGRNQEYGAYRLRKSNQRRLLVSFGYAIGFFIIVLSIYPLENLFHPKIYNLGYNYRAVNVSMTYDPNIQILTERSAGSSSASESIPDKIVDDDQVITPQQDAKLPSAGNSDSANAINNGTGSTGTGNSNIAGEGDAGEIFGSADVNPQFPGGSMAMQEFVNSNIHYPEIALSMNIRGTILVYVVIMSDGSLRDVKVVKGLQPELDAEVVRVVKSMPLWKPAMRAGIPVNVRCTWPITVSSKMGKM